MDTHQILNRLNEIYANVNSIIALFQKNGQISRAQAEDAQLLLKNLKLHLSSEYGRMDTVRGGKSLSHFESNFYHPAIRDSWANTGLSSLRWNSKPDSKWLNILFDVSGYMSYWKANLLSSKSVNIEKLVS